MTNKFSLSRLEYLLSLNGKKFDSLPRPMQRRIDETQLVINVIEPGTPEEVMFNIIQRINTGGLTIQMGKKYGMHYTKAPFAGLKSLAASDEFQRATDYSVNMERMAERECVLHLWPFTSIRGRTTRLMILMAIWNRDGKNKSNEGG